MELGHLRIGGQALHGVQGDGRAHPPHGLVTRAGGVAEAVQGGVEHAAIGLLAHDDLDGELLEAHPDVGLAEQDDRHLDGLGVVVAHVLHEAHVDGAQRVLVLLADRPADRPGQEGEGGHEDGDFSVAECSAHRGGTSLVHRLLRGSAHAIGLRDRCCIVCH